MTTALKLLMGSPIPLKKQAQQHRQSAKNKFLWANPSLPMKTTCVARSSSSRSIAVICFINGSRKGERRILGGRKVDWSIWLISNSGKPQFCRDKVENYPKLLINCTTSLSHYYDAISIQGKRKFLLEPESLPLLGSERILPFQSHRTSISSGILPMLNSNRLIDMAFVFYTTSTLNLKASPGTIHISSIASSYCSN